MVLQDSDEYFPSPSTPIRHGQLKSPDGSISGKLVSGSVSSSLIASPPKRNDFIAQERFDGPEDEEPTTPAVQQLKQASGFASVRVGLGSPNLMLKRTGTSMRIDERRGSGDRLDGLPQDSMTGQTLVSRDSGLPTPPSTDSDIVQPPPIVQRVVSHNSRKSQSPQSSPPRPPRHPRRTSSQHLPSLPDPDSPGPSSLHGSPHPRSDVFQRRPSPSISRSSSASSSLLLSSVKERLVQQSPAEGSSTLRRSQRSQASASSRQGSTTEGDRREVLASPQYDQYRSGSVSPRKAHQRSPSLPVEPLPRPSFAPKYSHGSSRSGDTIDEEREIAPVRSPVGTSLDDRIREAEEKIKRTTSRRPRTAGNLDSSPPISGGIRRHDSYSRGTRSPSYPTSTTTIRRSTTLSSVAAITPNGDHNSDSSGRRNGTTARVAAMNDVHERENSGGSGSSGRRKPIPTEFRNGSLFSPPSKLDMSVVKTDLPSSRSTSRFATDSPAYTSSGASKNSPSPRYATTSRLQNSHTSPIDRFRPPKHVELRQSPLADKTIGNHTATGDWRDSISGLPQASVTHSRLPALRQDDIPSRRADSVLGTNKDKYRYERRGGSVESALAQERNRNQPTNGLPSRLLPRQSIGPGDSVSVVGGHPRQAQDSTSKDPLELLKRMEEKRNQHREQWEAERSASVIGEYTNHTGPRPTSRLFDTAPRHARPSTSMSSMREIYEAPVPRTAPSDTWRARRDQVMAADSPLVGRGSSRLAQLHKPVTEPRPMRSSTSMGGRSSISLDFAAPGTEHGRLLFEACRALEFKFGPDILSHVPELVKTLHSTSRTAEHVNSSIRDALQSVTDTSVKLDLDDIDQARRDIVKLEACIRDAGRASDQNVRDLTRVLLDLPKLLRQADKAGLRAPRTSAPSQYDYSPNRAHHDMMRPSTSLGEIGSPTYRYSLDSRRPVLQPRLHPHDRDRSSAVSSLVAKMKGLTPKKSPLPQQSDLQTIEQSPPHQLRSSPSKSPLISQSISRSSLALSSSPSKSSRSTTTPHPPPRSPERPERRNVLRKKVSSTSTHTVRGSSAFMPTYSKVQTTTALSVVNAGHHDRDSSLGSDLTPAKSIRSVRTMSTTASEDYAGSPSSGYFAIDQDTRNSTDSGGSGQRGEDAVSILEHSLAAAAKARDGEEKKPSVSERFRATLRRGSSMKVKE